MNTDKDGKVMLYSVLTTSDTCPACGSKTMEMRNYNMAFHDGDIHCASCGAFVRYFDAG